MLVNLPNDWDSSPENPYAQALEDFEYGWNQFSPGQYLGLPSFAIEHLVENPYPFQGHLRARNGTDEELRALMQEILRQEREDAPQDFGVCDHPEQIVERWPQLEADPRPFIINFRQVGPDADWKPEKHGKHIGSKKPWEESVWTFHIYQIRGTS